MTFFQNFFFFFEKKSNIRRKKKSLFKAYLYCTYLFCSTLFPVPWFCFGMEPSEVVSEESLLTKGLPKGLAPTLNVPPFDSSLLLSVFGIFAGGIGIKGGVSSFS